MELVPKALQKQHELSFDGPNQPIWLQGDAVLLKELLANLIENAISYGRVNGNVNVRLTADEHSCLLVEDDGDGISASEQERFFVRFYRIQGSPGDGFGLGLSIVKEIVDLHQANIQISYRFEGQGTVIRVTF